MYDIEIIFLDNITENLLRISKITYSRANWQLKDKVYIIEGDDISTLSADKFSDETRNIIFHGENCNYSIKGEYIKMIKVTKS